MAVYETDPAMASQIISRAIESIKVPMKRYEPNGTYPEGYSYWAYGTTYNVIFLDALKKLTKTTTTRDTLLALWLLQNISST